MSAHNSSRSSRSCGVNMMNWFSRKKEKEKMLESVAKCREHMKRAPASKFVIEFDEVLKNIEFSYASDKEPSDEQVKQTLKEMEKCLELLLL